MQERWPVANRLRRAPRGRRGLSLRRGLARHREQRLRRVRARLPTAGRRDGVRGAAGQLVYAAEPPGLAGALARVGADTTPPPEGMRSCGWPRSLSGPLVSIQARRGLSQFCNLIQNF